jgi:4,5-DOPA dioxygenase extradiol
MVSSSEAPDTIHDFYGFPDALFRVQYRPAGAPAFANRVADLLVAAGMTVEIDPARGLDHGAWVPLRQMYPAADVPVFQLAIQAHQSPEHHWRLGRSLAALRDENVLIIGSGSMTHNLRALDFTAEEDVVTDALAAQFVQWMHAQLIDRPNLPALLDYRRQAPGAVHAHHSDEHLLPLFVALGTASHDCAAARWHAGYTAGGLAMDVYAFN